MHKYLSFLLFSLIFWLGFNSNALDGKNYSPNVGLTVTSTPVNTNEAKEISLDKEFVCLPCEPGNQPVPGSRCSGNMTVTVSAGKSENNQLKYEYIISDGQIIGEGAKVVWDMTGARPGTYQIKVNIENKLNGEKQTEIKTVDVIDSDCFHDCECPTLWIVAPELPTKAGATMTFIANVTGGSQPDVTYNWTVSEGKIIEGQGTPVIKVGTNSKMAGKIVKATVEVGGICENCLRTESANVSITNIKRGKK